MKISDELLEQLFSRVNRLEIRDTTEKNNYSTTVAKLENECNELRNEVFVLRKELSELKNKDVEFRYEFLDKYVTIDQYNRDEIDEKYLEVIVSKIANDVIINEITPLIKHKTLNVDDYILTTDLDNILISINNRYESLLNDFKKKAELYRIDLVKNINNKVSKKDINEIINTYISTLFKENYNNNNVSHNELEISLNDKVNILDYTLDIEDIRNNIKKLNDNKQVITTEDSISRSEFSEYMQDVVQNYVLDYRLDDYVNKKDFLETTNHIIERLNSTEKENQNLVRTCETLTGEVNKVDKAINKLFDVVNDLKTGEIQEKRKEFKEEIMKLIEFLIDTKLKQYKFNNDKVTLKVGELENQMRDTIKKKEVLDLIKEE